MGCTPAPACTAALKEATAKWPTRRRNSDGICASPKHTKANPNSDHEPHVVHQKVAYATAFDLSDDKANGCDADALVEYLRLKRDPRIKYVIAERRMYSSYPTSRYPAWTWRPYTGSNPHSSHVHVSIHPQAIFDVSEWWPSPEEGELTDDDRKLLKRIHHELVVGEEGDRPATVAEIVERIERRLTAIEKKLGV